jgi:hypothetical protein
MAVKAGGLTEWFSKDEFRAACQVSVSGRTALSGISTRRAILVGNSELFQRGPVQVFANVPAMGCGR